MTDPKGLMGAISDLARAELGNSVEALILSVAELWLLPPPSPSVDDQPITCAWQDR